MSISDDIRNIFTRSGNGLGRLLLINIFLFLIANISLALFRLSGSESPIIYWLSVPGNSFELPTRFWTLITYMFLHKDLFHILFNMLWLYWIGKILAEYAGSNRLVGVYLLGGLSGGLLFSLVAFLFPLQFGYSYLLGASAGVMAVVIATAILLPDYMIHLMFLGGVRLKYVAMVSFILTTVIDLSENTGGKVAHLGGALFGLIYMIQYKKGKDMTRPVTYLLTGIQNLFKPRPKVRVTYKRTTSDDDYNKNRKAHQERIDQILDKISKSGYEALSAEEKELLFRESKKG